MNDETDRHPSAGPSYVRLGCIPETKAIDVEQRTVTHLISTAAFDRGGDVIDVEGWDLANYKRNPTVLADHTYGIQSIIGRATKVEKTPEGLIATTLFHDYGLGAYAFDLVAADMARAWSVGFQGVEAHWISETEDCAVCDAIRRKRKKPRYTGRHFTSQELLEYSLVAIPANPDVVNSAVAKGIVTAEAMPELLACGLFRVGLSTDEQRERLDSVLRSLRSTGDDAAPREATVDPSRAELYESILGAVTTARRVEASIEISTDALLLRRRSGG